jgi:hypothetical protein
MKNKPKWLSSKEVQTTAKIKSYDLMHYRIEGKLEFVKLGNAYYYSEESLNKIKPKS